MTLVAEAWGVPSSKRRGQKTESETAIELVASKTKSRNGTRSLATITVTHFRPRKGTRSRLWPRAALHTPLFASLRSWVVP